MSFLPEVTSQPSHICVRHHDTLIGVFCSALHGLELISACDQRSPGCRSHKYSTRDCPIPSSLSTFASIIVADIVSLFGQLLSQMPHRLLDDLFLAVLVSPEALSSLPCCPFSSLVCVRLRLTQSTRLDVARHRDRPSLHASHQWNPCGATSLLRYHAQSVHPKWTMIRCASTSKEDNTGWDDQYMDGVRNMFSLHWLGTDGCHGDGL